MNRFTGLSLALAAGAVLICPGAAKAADNELSVRIVAVVQPFCRIFSASGDDGAMVNGGMADFGAVRELCNMPNGYTVKAQFRNLNGGTLRAGDSLLPISADGSVNFASGTAGFRTRNWSVFDIDPAVESRIYMRVSISPL